MLKKTLVLAQFLFLIFAGTAISQERDVATSGNCSPIISNFAAATINCFAQDTEESLVARHEAVLEGITSHTPLGYITQEMGEPQMVAGLNESLEMRVWNSINFQLFVVLEKSRAIAFGVMGNPDTKIPILRWVDKDRLKHQILADQVCDSPPTDFDARFVYFEVSGCWQGRGGGYFYYEYAFYGHSCLDESDFETLDFSSLIELRCAEEITPFLALVRVDGGDEIPEPLIHFVTEFFFWNF